ncbi:hypothetical protein [Alicyclobacillus dauci]|uniref:Uncharacterized protein n=1 Tax=Alicyclobacillus dauci TaxID=1475485 RepID=A0ABY6YX72_9BACL|nr:hypothetical protein [Alicyclobacillus dauci]WAH35179.1 hypothetical protein NZD86_12725 [Alicyclobacillus dauci]
MTLPHHVNTDELLIQAINQDISFLPGSMCYVDGVLHNQLRISFSYLSDDDLAQGVRRLCTLLQEAMQSEPHSHSPTI